MWSLGILLYEMISGTTPFVAKTNEEIMQKIKSKILKIPSSFSTELKDLV